MMMACLGGLAGCGVQVQGPLGLMFGLNGPAPADVSSGALGPTMSAETLSMRAGEELVPILTQAEPEVALRGLILRVTALAPTQGFSGARLAANNEGEPDENGVVTFAFLAVPPRDPRPVGAEQTRELVAAAFVPNASLEEITSFRIVSAGNAVDLQR